MSHGKQITLFTHKSGPNGWKVAIVLAELGLSYESVYLDFNKGENKAEAHTKYNPNGRIPTIIDHANNDFVVWESGAILTYLVEKYDKQHKLSVSGFEDKIIQLQWIFFQASGQGPYFGQGVWFSLYHPEKVPSAVERYQKEAVRVLGVLESVLSKQEWLVGGKCTVADLSFVPWNRFAFGGLLKDFEGFNLEKDFPAVAAWHAKLLARAAVASVFAIKESS
ncbi:glutathione S-transferase C-terminal-like protein [Sparassis latifolia]|uniref:glutathione transferase n=1 Tax=Sparassis crispa TaxID=139825 RepID=A0A401H3T2_9APHY|nr:Glutathione S-transferase 2 [Sparassis crispa]GBE89061.1 Glutathione S-transferase 2 [Sparassis crispa]